ncbi:hypothetical protein NDU88_006745 [Pleurodeles waltl]|uniref:Uncharacterized protein n=1 Tax=Pleurodeles waltl TaxID=8319 RepID=A0AAV7MFV3_PLEWA|nr:hypothetical protein NDU88_006745 [Pleurodeles waltl]
MKPCGKPVPRRTGSPPGCSIETGEGVERICSPRILVLLATRAYFISAKHRGSEAPVFEMPVGVIGAGGRDETELDPVHDMMTVRHLAVMCCQDNVGISFRKCFFKLFDVYHPCHGARSQGKASQLIEYSWRGGVRNTMRGTGDFTGSLGENTDATQR